MNWLRILSTTALAVSLAAIGAVIWLSDSQNPDAFQFISGYSKATVVIQLNKPSSPIPPSTQNVTSNVCTTDLTVFAKLLESRKFRRRVLDSLNSDEFFQVFGSSFMQSLNSPFTGVKILPDSTNCRVSIIATHRDPSAARLIAGRYYSQFIRSLLDQGTGIIGPGERFQEKRSAELHDQAKSAAANFTNVRQSQDQKAISDAERALSTAQAAARREDESIKREHDYRISPASLPLRLLSAHVKSGPFWNRTTTDFTTDAERLSGPSE